MPRYKADTIGTPRRRKVKTERRIRTPRIVGDTDDPVESLDPKKQIYVKQRALGATNRAASTAAGVSKETGSTYSHQPDVQAAFRHLMQVALPAENVVKLIKGGAFATMTDYDQNGQTKKVPDWKTRRPYIQMAAEQAGYIETKQDAGSAIIQVNVTHVGTNAPSQPRPTITAEANPSTPSL